MEGLPWPFGCGISDRAGAKEAGHCEPYQRADGRFRSTVWLLLPSS